MAIAEHHSLALSHEADETVPVDYNPCQQSEDTVYAGDIRQLSDRYDTFHRTIYVPGADHGVPVTYRIPKELRHPMLHVFVPGFGGIKRSSRAPRDAMAGLEGLATASYDPLRFGGGFDAITDAKRLHMDTVMSIFEDFATSRELDEAANIQAISRDKAVLVAHSMGTPTAITYAEHHPDDIALVTMLEGVGAERPGFVKFLPRLLKSAGLEIAPAIIGGKFGTVHDGLTILTKGAYYMGANPLRTIGEIRSCSVADVMPSIPVLQANNVKVAMIYGTKDQLIPALPAIERCGSIVDRCVLLDMDHFGPQTQSALTAYHIAKLTHELIELDQSNIRR